MSKKIIGATVGTNMNPEKLFAGGGGATPEDVAAAVESYMAEHPVEETDPTVPAWAKAKDKPSYTAQEVGALPADTEIPVVPTKVSAFDNDAGYLTKHQDLSGYAKTEDIPTNPSDIGAQPAGNYLTEVPDGYAKTEDIPTTPADIGAQPAGNYALKSEIPSVPVKSVNGKTGAVSLSASDVGADASGTAASAVSGHNTNSAAHSDIRLMIDGLTSRINALANSTDEDLDQMAELVAYIKNNKSLIDGITTSKVNVADIVNNLTTNVSNKPLSAAQGVALKSLVDGLQSGKLDASALTAAINTALAQAKASGEFTGATGQRGTGLLPVTIAPSGYTTAVGGITPKYRMSLSTIKTQAGVTEVLLGDTVRYSYYHYPIDYLDASYAYFTERVSIRGSTGAAGKDAVLTMFISPDGNDSNDGLTASTPKKTVAACVTAGANRVSAKRGVYKEIVSLSNIGELEILPTDNDLTYAVGVEREPIIFDTSDSIAVSSLAAYNSIKRVAYSNSANTQFSKVFTEKSQTPIYGDGNGSRYNATVWLLSSDEKAVCIKLKPVLTVAECEAQANTFTYVSGYIYINANMTSVAKIVVPTNWDCGIYVNGAERFVLKEVEVRFAGSYNIDIRNCAYFDFYKCACKYTSYGSGFHPFNSNGKLTACYATKNYDGYGISGYGHTTYVDCVSEFNFDDGMSHHNATSGTVIGGRYEGNGKGGNTPAYGAKVNIYGGLYKDNASFGIGYLWATDLEPASGMVQGAVMVGNPIGLSVQKNCDVTAMNCTYQGNTSDKDAKGNLVEYNANYVKTVNGTKPDENGNVEIDVSGGPAYTNLLPLATDATGAVYNGTGYENGYRLNSSATRKEQAGCGITGFIPAKSGDVIRMKNYGLCSVGYQYLHWYKSDFSYHGAEQLAELLTPDATGTFVYTVADDASRAYVRISVGEFSENTIITVNEEITD